MKKRTALRATVLLLAFLFCLAPGIMADDSSAPDGDEQTAETASSPTPSAKPTPDMTLVPTPESTPTVTVTPTAIPLTPSATPEPTDAPADDITPEPVPTLSTEPTPDTTPESMESPEPSATPNPATELEPTSDPTVTPEPEQTPVPLPDPTPVPTPNPPTDSPTGPPTEPSPDPSPAPALEPTASPAPEGDDSEESPGQDGSGGLELTSNKPRLDWTGVVPADDGGMPIPRLYQFDYKTVLCRYNDIPRSVSTSGCNVTCVAMVAAYLTGEEHSPEALFSWALKKNLYHGNGLGHSTMSKMAEHCGVSGKWIGRDGDAVIEALNAGKPVIAHMGPGLFTSHGHYIVLRGVTEDGKILVNDPNSKHRSGLAYPMRTILRETRNSTPFMVCDVI